jgi:hypothetical protein
MWKNVMFIVAQIFLFTSIKPSIGCPPQPFSGITVYPPNSSLPSGDGLDVMFPFVRANMMGVIVLRGNRLYTELIHQE